jgi:DNA-binding GntR family transcriptional regulator
MSINALTKAASIYQEIKKNIMSGILQPGTHLIIKQIATQYGISDIPVREALKELNAEGLVETIPHVGSRVANISLENISDMLVMREYLEPFAAELATVNADDQVIKKLEAAYRAMNEAFQVNDIDKYGKLNKNFHFIIIQASGNQILIRTIFELIESEKRMRMIFQIFPEVLESSNREHGEIIELIKQRNKLAVKQLMYEHKKRSFDKMRKYFKI